MRIRFVAVTLALCAACVFDIPQSSPPVESRQAEAIDFDALRAQATAALNALEQSHERRMASVTGTAF